MHETIPQQDHAAVEAVRGVPCPQCWQHPGCPCADGGSHLARYQRAERRGLVSRAELAAVVGRLEVIAAHVIVPDVTP